MDEDRSAIVDAKKAAEDDHNRQLAAIRTEYGHRKEMVRAVQGRGLFLAFFQC